MRPFTETSGENLCSRRLTARCQVLRGVASVTHGSLGDRCCPVFEKEAAVQRVKELVQVTRARPRRKALIRV